MEKRMFYFFNDFKTNLILRKKKLVEIGEIQ